MNVNQLDELGRVFAHAAVDNYLADYERRANEHRPPHADALATEASRLHAGGLESRDTCQALRIDSAQVKEILGKKEGAQ